MSILEAQREVRSAFLGGFVGQLVSGLIWLIARLYTALKYGWAVRHINPRDEIRKLGDRPARLIHARGDSQVPHTNFERLVARAPAHVETWESMFYPMIMHSISNVVAVGVSIIAGFIIN